MNSGRFSARKTPYAPPAGFLGALGSFFFFSSRAFRFSVRRAMAPFVFSPPAARKEAMSLSNCAFAASYFFWYTSFSFAAMVFHFSPASLVIADTGCPSQAFMNSGRFSARKIPQAPPAGLLGCSRATGMLFAELQVDESTMDRAARNANLTLMFQCPWIGNNRICSRKRSCSLQGESGNHV